MRLTSAIAVYFIVWWVCLFMVLPWGVRNAHESGEPVAEGNEPGAPVNPRLLRKAAITTLLATVIFALIYGAITRGWIGFEDIPFLDRMPGTG
jgi:predicted secreted protein